MSPTHHEILIRPDDAPLTLLEVLNKCHRHELLPLARLLKIGADGLGLSDLSAAIENQLRRQGGVALGNLLRGQQGPPYPLIAKAVAEHLELNGDGHIEEIEGRVVRRWLEKAWDELDDEQRAGLWGTFGDPSEGTPDGRGITSQAAMMMGDKEFTFRSASLAAFTVTGAGLLGFFARPFFPLFIIAGLIKAMGPQLKITLPAVIQVAMLRQQVRHRLTLGVVGSPSSGKDAAINAIFGIDSGNVNPVAGSTREVSVTQVPGATALFVVNTPGMGDIVEAVTEEAKQVLAHIDVYVYVLNAEGGVQKRELSDYDACLATGKPTLVCLNKIDLIRPKDQEGYIADARQKLGGESVVMIPCAFDPFPQISPIPIALDQVRAWIQTEITGLGKEPIQWPDLPVADEE